MADEADLASDLQERALAAALANRKNESLPATGRCHYCDETLSTPGARFCDVDCARDYEHEQKLKKRAAMA